MVGARLSRRSEGDESSASTSAAARGGRGGVAPAGVLALQRTAGNRAVASVLRARSPVRAIQRTPMIQDWDSTESDEDFVERDGEWFKVKVPKFPRTIDAAKLNFFQLDEWLERAKSHDVDKKLIKEVADLRDTRAPAHDPRIAIKAFEDSTDQLAFDVDRKDVGRHLRTVLKNPEKINQGQYGLCGPDAFLRVIAIRHPEAYASYVIDLVRTGDGQIGNLNIHASKDVRRKHIAPGAKRHGIEAADWAALASLRVDKNERYKAIGNMDRSMPLGVFSWIHHGIASGTDPDELADWAAQLGLPPSKIEMRLKKRALVSNVYAKRAGSFGNHWNRIQALRNQGWDVMLAIHQKVMNNTGELPRVVVGGHFVLLSSDIVAETKNGHAGRGFDAMTWGGIEHGWFRDTDAGIALIGYVGMDLSGPLGPAVATGPKQDIEVSSAEIKSTLRQSSGLDWSGRDEEGKGRMTLIERDESEREEKTGTGGARVIVSDSESSSSD